MTITARIFHLPLRYVLMDRRRKAKRERISLHVALLELGFRRISRGVAVRRYRNTEFCPGMLTLGVERRMGELRVRYLLKMIRHGVPIRHTIGDKTSNVCGIGY